MTTDIFDTPEQRRADQKFIEDMSCVLESIENDPTPIAGIHSTGWENGCFYIWLDMADGREVPLRFDVGQPIPSVKKPRPPIQYTRIRPFQG